MTNPCPCCSGKDYALCCEPFILGKQKPDTAEKLMRSRYTAYTKVDVPYIKKTSAPEFHKEFDIEGTRKWAQESQWMNLKILSTEARSPKDTKGIVEFIATFIQNEKTIEHHERSYFRKDNTNTWLFVDGETPKTSQPTITRESPKIGRNDPCPCGSKKKYKKCCSLSA